jgi:hypothetical protein
MVPRYNSFFLEKKDDCVYIARDLNNQEEDLNATKTLSNGSNPGADPC